LNRSRQKRRKRRSKLRADRLPPRHTMEVRDVDEAYRPVIDDGRGRFPEDLRVKAPREAKAAIAAAAERKTYLPLRIRAPGAVAKVDDGNASKASTGQSANK